MWTIRNKNEVESVFFSVDKQVFNINQEKNNHVKSYTICTHVEYTLPYFYRLERRVLIVN